MAQRTSPHQRLKFEMWGDILLRGAQNDLDLLCPVADYAEPVHMWDNYWIKLVLWYKVGAHCPSLGQKQWVRDAGFTPFRSLNMFGTSDPMSRSLLAGDDTVVSTSLFGEVSHVQAGCSTFNSTAGDQYNNNISFSTAFTVPGHQTSNIPLPVISQSTSLPPIVSTQGTQGQVVRRSAIARLQKPARMPGNINLPQRTPSDNVMLTLYAASLFSLIPILAQAARVVLAIFQGVQSPRCSQGDLLPLASYACTLVTSVIIMQQQRKEGLPLEIVASVWELVKKLRPIAKFVCARHCIGRAIKRLLSFTSERALVTQYRDKLVQALAEFGLRIGTHFEDGVAQIDVYQEEVMQMIGSQTNGPPPPTYPPLLPANTPSASTSMPGVPGSVNSHVAGNQINHNYNNNILIAESRFTTPIPVSTSYVTPHYPTTTPHTPDRTTALPPSSHFRSRQVSAALSDNPPLLQSLFPNLQSRYSHGPLPPQTSVARSSHSELDGISRPLPRNQPDGSREQSVHARRQNCCWRARKSKAGGRTQPCRFYALGNCKYGDDCRFPHTPPHPS